MKRWLVALTLAAVSLTAVLPTAVEAKRLGGGGSSGMQRSLPARTPDSVPAKPAAPAAVPQHTPAAPAAPAAAPKRSWMGPLAGLAAGLGIGALMSHFGMGAEFGNFLTMLLVGGLAFVAIRFLMARFGPQRAAAPAGLQYAGMGAAGNGPTSGGFGGHGPAAAPASAPAAFGAGTALPPLAPVMGAAVSTAAAGPALPPGFDLAAFERTARLIFIRMQAANDAADLNDLRAFTTSEMFAAVRLDLQDRGALAQQTDVERVEAQVLDVAEEAGQQIVSVRFHGLIREERSAAVAAPFDEVWHLVKPLDGSREWAISGIQQTA